MVPRKFWKEIHNNLFIGNIKSNVVNTQVQSRTGELVEGLSAACEINSYYATVGEKLAAPFDMPWTPTSIFLQCNSDSWEKRKLLPSLSHYQQISLLRLNTYL